MYDLSALSPEEFEELVRDLLQKKLDVPLHAFKKGIDGGIDLRHAANADGSLIVQCKHMPAASFAQLQSKLKPEVRKVKHLKPGRYVVATSAGLTPQNADRIRKMFAPYCHSADDVFGRDTLLGLLRDNKAIALDHFKLWLSGTGVLQRLLDNASFTRSGAYAERIKREFVRFVPTTAVAEARRLLEERRVCLITGDPGSGKTTLADILVGLHLATDPAWELVVARRDVSEIWHRYDPDPQKKQLFYFDECFGEPRYDDRLERNEAADLVGLIRKLREGNRRLILTAREYVIKWATAQTEKLSEAELALDKYVVRPSSFTLADRARILANHLYFSGVPEEHVRAVVESPLCAAILGHRNYNPRVLEVKTARAEVNSCKPADFPALLLEALEHPTSMWDHAYRNQLRPAARHLLTVLTSLGPVDVLGEDLRRAFDAHHLRQVMRYSMAGDPLDFQTALDETDTAFVRKDPLAGGGFSVVLENHSFRDYLVDRWRQYPQELTDLLEDIVYPEQLEEIMGRITNGSDAAGDWEPLVSAGDHVPKALSTSYEVPPPAKAVHWSQSGVPTAFGRLPANRPERLIFALRSAKHVTVARPFVLQKVERFWGDVQAETIRGDAAGIVHVLDAAEEVGWCADQWKRWQELSLASLMVQPVDSYEAKALARWFVLHESLLLEGDRIDFLDGLCEFVRREIDELIDEWELSEFDERGLALFNVTDLLERVGVEFDDEFEQLRAHRAKLEEEWEDNMRTRRPANPAPPDTPKLATAAVPYQEVLDALTDALSGQQA